jgi:multicomponent Na+:H+ antiporter subunit G
MEMAITVLLCIGLFFNLVGVLGVLRMPDVFTRLQASTCVATMGTISLVLSGVLYALSRGMGAGVWVKLALMLVLVLGTNPISNHALCKAAYQMGVKPEREMVLDDWKEDAEA